MTELKVNHFTSRLLAPQNSIQLGHYNCDIETETAHLLQLYDIIKREIESDDSSKPHISWQIVHRFVSSLATEDPNPLHYTISRSTLTLIDPELLNNQSAVDLLARHLNEFCKKLKCRFYPPQTFQDLIERTRKQCEAKVPDTLSLEILKIPSTKEEIETAFEFKGMFIQDAVFLKVLASTGIKGAAYAKEMKDPCIRRLQNYKNTSKTPLGFWFNLTPKSTYEPLFLSPCLQTLASALWDDIVKRLVHFTNHQLPALSTNVHEPLTKLLSPKNEIIKSSDNIQLSHNEIILGSIPIAVLHRSLLDIVISGTQKLSSVMAHRLIRFLPQKAFEQMARGDLDFRVIKRDRGATEIAEELGLTTNKSITEIKEILLAMQFFEFSGKNSIGNLIALEKYTSPFTKRCEAYQITVGTALLPYQTFNAYKHHECGLLIPILPDPPLVGANQFHSGQYLFQMYVAWEFSKHSHLLAKEGAILITQERREEFATLCGLTPELLSRVWDRYTNDGDDGAKFLERVEGEFYTLGNTHERSLDFLKKQGQLRISQSQRGKKAALNRAKAKNKLIKGEK